MMHLNIYGGLFRFFYIMLLRLDVTRCNLRIVLFVSLFMMLSLSLLTTGSSVPLTLLVQWLYHNTGIFQQSSEVVFDYFHPILQLFFLVRHMVILSVDRLDPGVW